MIRRLVVISAHEKGFWCAVYYSDAPENSDDEWPVPDGYCTGKKGGTISDIVALAESAWTGVEIVFSGDDEDGDTDYD